MNTFFVERLNIVHTLIDAGDYDTPINLIHNIKTRIHDQDLLKKLSEHDEYTEKEFLRYYNEVREINDPFVVYDIVMKLKLWRAREYLTYYDKMVKDVDL